jgi:hypothetical protein
MSNSRITKSAFRGDSVLNVVPLTLEEANALVERLHRHHKPARGHKFSIGLAKCGEVVGAAIVSRPTARMSDDGWTLEVVRLVTDGTKNACSALYAAAWRATRAMGYKRLITYTLPEEGGASLRAAGWRCIGTAGGGTWSRKTRPRVDLHPLQEKLRWEAS